MTPETPFQIRDGRFDEFEEFVEAFHDAGWEADYLQLAKGRFSGQMFFTGSESSQISLCHWEKKLRHQGLPPKGTVSLGVTLSQRGDTGRYLGAPMGLDDIIVNPDDGELEIFSAPTWEAAVFVMPKVELREQVAALTRRDPDRVLRNCGLAKLSKPQSARLRWACERYFRAVAHPPQPQSIDQRRPLILMAAELSALVTSLIADAQVEPLPRPSYRRRLEIINKVEEYAESASNDALRIPDLCRQLGTSERTLRYAFADLVGVSPAAYLKARRLSRVHAALLQADPGKTLVKTVAYQFGFWHLGQFALDYRRHFEEAPSATLARE